MSRAEAMADLIVAHGQLGELVRDMLKGGDLWAVPGKAAEVVNQANQLLQAILHNAEFLAGVQQ